MQLCGGDSGNGLDEVLAELLGDAGGSHLTNTFGTLKEAVNGTEIVALHIVPYKIEFVVAHRLGAKTVYLMVDFIDSGLNNVAPNVGRDEKDDGTTVDDRLAIDSVSVALVFTDIGHKTRAEIATKQCVEYGELSILGVAPFEREDASNADGGLDGVGYWIELRIGNCCFATVIFSSRHSITTSRVVLWARLMRVDGVLGRGWCKERLVLSKEPVVEIASKLEVGLAKMVAVGVKLAKVIQGETINILGTGKCSKRVVGAVEGLVEDVAGDVGCLLKRSLKLMTAFAKMGLELDFGKGGLLDELAEEREQLRGVLLEGIDGDAGGKGVKRWFYDDASVVDKLGHLGG